MERITADESALIYVDWRISHQLGQAPAAVKSIECRPYGPVKYAPPTGGSLDAIYFPAFVADFLQGTFEAIVDASIQQMEAFGELLDGVAKSLDEFMADDTSDKMAIKWMVGAFPGNFKIDGGGDRCRLVLTSDLTDEEKGCLHRTLDLPVDPDVGKLEKISVPAARRRTARARRQLFSSTILMGINRIVVTDGAIH